MFDTSLAREFECWQRRRQQGVCHRRRPTRPALFTADEHPRRV